MTTMNVSLAIVLSHLLGMAVMLGLLHVRRWWRRRVLYQSQSRRLIPLGFEPVVLPARTGTAPRDWKEGVDFVESVSRPQQHFHPREIVFSPENVEGIEVIDFRIGHRSQLANANSVPASTFQDASPPLKFHVAQIAQDVKFLLRNTTDSPKTVSIAILGNVYDRYEDTLLL
jgi:hypothetical protein